MNVINSLEQWMQNNKNSQTSNWTKYLSDFEKISNVFIDYCQELFILFYVVAVNRIPQITDLKTIKIIFKYFTYTICSSE